MFALVDLQREYVGSGVVADHVQVEPGSGNVVKIEFGAKDAFPLAQGSGEYLAERRDDDATAADQTRIRR